MQEGVFGKKRRKPRKSATKVRPRETSLISNDKIVNYGGEVYTNPKIDKNCQNFKQICHVHSKGSLMYKFYFLRKVKNTNTVLKHTAFHSVNFK